MEKQDVARIQYDELSGFDQWLIFREIAAKEEIRVETASIQDQGVRSGYHLQTAVFRAFGA